MASPAVRWQVAALPYKLDKKGKLKILLVSSRETGRWVVPKGWPMKKRTDHKSALKEARQEAGVDGDVMSTPLGTYEYFKRLTYGFELVEVTVFPLKVRSLRKDWWEKSERKRIWVTPREAELMVNEPQLISIMRTLANEPKLLTSIASKVRKTDK